MNTMNAQFNSRRYSDEEKAKAIDFFLKENLSCAKTAQRLGLHPSNLSRWLRQYRIDQGEALPLDSGLLSELSNEKDRSPLLLLQLAFTAAKAAVRMIAVGSMDASQRF